MERWDLVYRGAAAFGGTTIVYLYGGWSALLGILLSFVVADYLTGLGAAWVKKELSSSVGARGIIKKMCIFLMAAVGNLIDRALGTELVMNATIFFFIANELISIIENAGVIGIPIPPVLSDAVQVLKGKSEVSTNAEEKDS